MRKFNGRASQLANTVVLCISADLPFAQARFCGAEGLENVVTLSTMRGREFLRDYGVELAGGPLGGRLGPPWWFSTNGTKVLHSELVGEIKNESGLRSGNEGARLRPHGAAERLFRFGIRHAAAHRGMFRTHYPEH